MSDKAQSISYGFLHLNILILCAFLLVALGPDFIVSRRSGGGGGGGGRAGGSRSSYGSSSSSGRSSASSNRYASSSSSSSSAGRYGSSAPSGSGGFSSGGGFGGASKSSYPSGASYRAPSGTMGRFASPGVARSSAPRPQASIPRATQTYPTRVQYSTTYNNYYGSSYGRRGSGSSMLLAGGAGLLGGYYLGSMMGRLSHPGYGYGYGGYGYGYSPYYSSYVPYRERYGNYYEATTPSPIIATGSQSALPEPPKKDVDLCTLARWNRELPFAELPNMALEFLANDTITNATILDKSKFIYDFFKSSTDAYASYNSSADIFTIPSGYDLVQCNLLVDVQKFRPEISAGGAEEPILTSARNMINTYSNISKDGSSALQDVVDAAKACFPRGGIITHPEVLPCLDYTLNPDQLLKLEKPHSIFGSEEICRRNLNADMFKCMPSQTDSATCKLEHLVALNVFARNYYLCTEALEQETMTKIQQRSSQIYSDYYNSAPRGVSSRDILTMVLLSVATTLALLNLKSH